MRLKKEPGEQQRHHHWFIEQGVWSDTPPPMAGGRQDATAIVKTWRRRRPSVTGYLMSQGLLVARGTGARATVLPFTI